MFLTTSLHRQTLLSKLRLTPGPIRWAVGLLMALLLLVGYIELWRPARGWLVQEVAAPLLVSVSSPQQVQTQHHDALTATVYADDSAYTYRAPGGAWFLLSALLLIGLFPFKPYWLYFGLYHIGMGVFSLALLALGLAGATWGFSVYDFVGSYIMPATSLVFPLLVWLYAGPSNYESSIKATAAPPVLGVDV